MTSTIRRRLAATAAVAVAVSGCGHSAPMRFYTLAAVPPSQAAGSGYLGPVLEIGAVHVPPPLDRAELLTEASPDQLQVHEFERWGAPLPRLARAALIEDLALRLPTGRVALPNAPLNPSARRLEIDILDFTRRDGVARISAGWALTCSKGGDAPHVYRAELQAPLADGVARDLTVLLGRLADRIVAAALDDSSGACTDPAHLR